MMNINQPYADGLSSMSPRANRLGEAHPSKSCVGFTEPRDCNLCNYESYLKNMTQIGPDGGPVRTNHKALQALFECRLYEFLDDCCKRILISAIRKLSHSPGGSPVRMSLMAMYIQTESEADAEAMKNDPVGISLRALLDSLPPSVVEAKHESRVNDILYSLPPENRMVIKCCFPAWVRKIADGRERAMIQVIYRSLWFAHPYGIRNLGLRMLLQEEVAEYWESYKNNGRTLRELLLKYKMRIIGRREFLANDTLYKLKETGNSTSRPIIPSCTCDRRAFKPSSGNVFSMSDSLVEERQFDVSTFGQVVTEVLSNCGGDEASTMLIKEFKARCADDEEYKDSDDAVSLYIRADEITDRIVYIMRYDILCYFLSKRHPSVWHRLYMHMSRGTRRFRRDCLIELLKNADNFYLITTKVRTPIVAILNCGKKSILQDLRASAEPFVPSLNTVRRSSSLITPSSSTTNSNDSVSSPLLTPRRRVSNNIKSLLGVCDAGEYVSFSDHRPTACSNATLINSCASMTTSAGSLTNSCASLTNSGNLNISGGSLRESTGSMSHGVDHPVMYENHFKGWQNTLGVGLGSYENDYVSCENPFRGFGRSPRSNFRSMSMSMSTAMDERDSDLISLSKYGGSVGSIPQWLPSKSLSSASIQSPTPSHQQLFTAHVPPLGSLTRGSTMNASNSHSNSMSVERWPMLPQGLYNDLSGWSTADSSPLNALYAVDASPTSCWESIVSPYLRRAESSCVEWLR